MKLFTQLTLVSAIAVSGQAMALQALDDSTLSNTTGQDGITVTLNTGGIDISKLVVHDNDGLTNAVLIAGNDGPDGIAGNADDVAAISNGGTGVVGTTTSSGAIVINGVKLTSTSAGGHLATLLIDTDAGAGGTAPFLNVGVQTGNLNIKVASIAVASSNTTVTGARRGVAAATETKILSGYTAANNIDVTVGGSTLNIQLGNTPQGAMIIASGTVTGGLDIKNVAVVDAAGGGAIGLDRIRITDAASTNLTARAKIGVKPTGLSIALGDIAQDIYIDAVRFGSAAGIGTATSTIGSAASIGSVEIQGLSLTNTNVQVSGH